MPVIQFESHESDLAATNEVGEPAVPAEGEVTMGQRGGTRKQIYKWMSNSSAAEPFTITLSFLTEIAEGEGLTPLPYLAFFNGRKSVTATVLNASWELKSNGEITVTFTTHAPAPLKKGETL